MCPSDRRAPSRRRRRERPVARGARASRSRDAFEVPDGPAARLVVVRTSRSPPRPTLVGCPTAFAVVPLSRARTRVPSRICRPDPVVDAPISHPPSLPRRPTPPRTGRRSASRRWSAPPSSARSARLPSARPAPPRRSPPFGDSRATPSLPPTPTPPTPRGGRCTTAPRRSNPTPRPPPSPANAASGASPPPPRPPPRPFPPVAIPPRRTATPPPPSPIPNLEPSPP